MNLEQKIGIILAGVAVGYGFYFSNDIKEVRIKNTRKQLSASNTEQKQRSENIGDQNSLKTKRTVLKTPPPSEKLVDHPMFGWLVENSHPFLAAAIICKMHSKLNVGGSSTTMAKFSKRLLIDIFSHEFTIYYYQIVDKLIYGHIPYFNDNFQKQSYWDIFKDFVTCNLRVVIFNTALGTFLSKDKPKLYPKKFQPILFLIRLAFMRVIVDLLFYIGHYLIHLKKTYFIHKRHHEHNTVRLTTNYHFSATDLFIEASMPFIFSVAMGHIVGLDKGISFFEEIALTKYILQLEVVSHVGKPIQTMSTFPPFSMFTRKYDDWNPWFHALHHSVLRCNYSITPLWDYLLGTLRL